MYVLKALIVSCLFAWIICQSTDGHITEEGAAAIRGGNAVKERASANREGNGGNRNGNENRKRKKKDKTEQSSNKPESDSTVVVKDDSKLEGGGNEAKIERKPKNKETESKSVSTGEAEKIVQSEQIPINIQENTEEVVESSSGLYKPIFYLFFISLGLALFYFFGIKRLNGNPLVSVEKSPSYTHIEDAENGSTGEDEGWEEEDWGGNHSKEKSVSKEKAISTCTVPITSNSSTSSTSSNASSSHSKMLNPDRNDAVLKNHKKAKEMPERGSFERTEELDEGRGKESMKKPRSPPATVNTDYFSTIGIAAAPKFRDKVPSNNSLKSSKKSSKDNNSKTKYDDLERSDSNDRGAWGNDDDLDI